MSDLRDRIAAAIYRSQCTRYDDYPWEKVADYIKAVYGKQADAVIRELGLQVHLAKRIINAKPDQWVRRYVTDWEIVDE